MLPILLMGFSLACTTTERPPDGTGGGGGGGGGGGVGGGGGGGSTIDAGAIDAATSLNGTVCLTQDLRSPSACSAGSVKGIEVSVQGTALTLQTDSAGNFSFDNIDAATTVLLVASNHPTLRPTLLPLATNLRTGPLSIPLISDLDWEDLLAALGTSEPSGTGTIAVYVRIGPTPVIGAQVVADTSPIFYDDGSATQWTPDGLTGSSGAALIFGSQAGNASFQIIDPNNQAIDVTNVPVVAESTTFVFVDLN